MISSRNLCSYCCCISGSPFKNILASTNEDNVWLGSFDKRFTLPQDINTKKIKAKVENGVLTLKLSIKEDTENFIDIK